ncbi:anthranilate phosphoribosyltransferase family protein [Thermocoleostomius sinensis]|jgi:anthranilate phosphoribosyltransferase|uniref:Anthranilate phosphoribosyltransferase family protein n=1 Tax=Thermocoleostomius sinensis A174 TaxID=2016057 RepID=A0A9E8Z8W5_9CYAN|nr:anthranilate phosphoribosyltransferase family protein [Thermocoleostomius sinensis]WAL58659.1 anthranilate phosphoribosyltransferase family protein [Thermocoleostomius sinensis A174]
MSDAFRDLLRKVGSGSHTSEHLTREEAASATRLMLQQEATPAQIGAFMIAHRIKRPTGEELAGMLDAYDQLGPKLNTISSMTLPIVMGIPYDGRSRTTPVSPLVTLILAAAGCPVVLHGGRRMPTKEGIPLVEVWQALGVDWTTLSLEQTQAVFAETSVGFVYLPTHFPLSDNLVPYREQIGKRPPFATVELFWCPYAGEALLISGFVHPPTEEMARSAFALRGTRQFITVKGLEGSCDLPRDRTCIVGINQMVNGESTFERLLLHPRDYGFAAEEVPLLPTPKLLAEMQAVLQGGQTELSKAAIWNSGFYLWRSGLCPDLEAGFTVAEELLTTGKAAQKLAELTQAVQVIDGTTGKNLLKTSLY